MSGDETTSRVRRRYAEAARGVSEGRGRGDKCCGAGGTDPITRDLYEDADTLDLPEEAVKASLGCGNPTALADLRPGEVRESMELWIGCLAGALEADEYRRLLREEGFVEAQVEPTRIYRAEDARSFLEDAGLDADRVAQEVDGRFMAAFVRARKPSSS